MKSASVEQNMWTIFAQLLDRDLQKLHDEISAFSEESNLWKTTGSITNPAGNLCLHLTGSLNHFIGATLGNTGFVRQREGEFANKNVPRLDMLRELTATRIKSVEILTAMPEGSLEATFPRKFMEQDVSTAWFITHILTHISYHLGQVNYLRRVLEG